MGLWKSHRIRQAGKYARKSYRLELRRLRSGGAVLTPVRRTTPAELREIRDALAGIPERPDLEGR